MYLFGVDERSYWDDRFRYKILLTIVTKWSNTSTNFTKIVDAINGMKGSTLTLRYIRGHPVAYFSMSVILGIWTD